MILFELALIIVLLLVLFRTPKMRKWLTFLGSKHHSQWDLKIGATIVAILILGQIICLGRWTFPVVHWGMYTEVNQETEFYEIELVASDDAGNRFLVNPIQCYPSLVHCFAGRLVPLVKAARDGKLTKQGHVVYDDLMRSILDRHNQTHPRQQATSISAHLISVSFDRGNVLNRQLVSRSSLNPSDRLELASQPSHSKSDWSTASLSNSNLRKEQ